VNRIGGVMVSVLASRDVDRGFEPRSGDTKDYKIGIFKLEGEVTSLSESSQGDFWEKLIANNLLLLC
jgi:hypothetical protein